MRVIVCGGRDWCNSRDEHELEIQARVTNIILQMFDRAFNINTIISGGAKGADNSGEMWAHVNGKTLEVYEAKWNAEGKAAGAIRNKTMLKHGKPDFVIAFPGGAGTDNMRKIAMKDGIDVFVVSYYNVRDRNEMKVITEIMIYNFKTFKASYFDFKPLDKLFNS